MIDMREGGFVFVQARSVLLATGGGPTMYRFHTPSGDKSCDGLAMALRAGVDWLEAGTPLILAEGLHGVRKLREAFPGVPIVADLKTMDGGYLEAEMMGKAGATHVVVMARAHEETIRCVVNAGKDFGVKVMGDNLGCEDMVAALLSDCAVNCLSNG